MKLEFDKDQLLKLMKDFYILTGIRVVLYDDEYHQLLSWPEKDCAKPRHVHQAARTNPCSTLQAPAWH